MALSKYFSVVAFFLGAQFLSCVEAFTTPTGTSVQAQWQTLASKTALKECQNVEKEQKLQDINRDQLHDRRIFVCKIASVAAIATLGKSTPASAFDKAYPVELGFENDDTRNDLARMRLIKNDRKKLKKEEGMSYAESKNPFFFRGPEDLLSSAVWGGALWLLTGSRSNPLVTPLANIIYDEEKESWLKDRNDSLFGPVPAPLMIVLGATFFVFGIAADRAILFTSDGDANISLQLAGLSLIGGLSLELGRIASGEKKQNREDFDRESQLEQEFTEFAERRLMKGGNCHRNEVAKSFRRYFAKYRDSESTQYPLSDLEIERLLRSWNRSTGNAEMSSAGFFNGIQINTNADVFV